jgi:hypothetical protein
VGQWNPQRNNQRHNNFEPDLNDPEDRKEWNSDDEAFDEFGRKKKKGTKRKSEAKPEAKAEPSVKKIPAVKMAAAAAASAAASGSEKLASPNAVYNAVTALKRPIVSESSASAPEDIHGTIDSLELIRQTGSAQAALGLFRERATALKAMQEAEHRPVPFGAAVQRALAPPPGRLSTQEAAMQVAERQANSRNAPSNRGPNTGANAYHLRKQWKPVLPCKYFSEGLCRNGANCTFMHDRGDMCKFWVNGQCMKGELCTAVHPTPESATPQAAFTDFDTGDATSGLSYSAPGSTLMEKLWKGSSHTSDAPPVAAAAAAAPSQTLMDKMWKQRRPNQEDESKHSVDDARFYSGYSLAQQNQAVEKNSKSNGVSSSSSAAVEYPEKEREPTREEVVQRMQAATVKALTDRDASSFLKELEALRKYIPEQEYTITKATIEKALAPQAFAANMNQELQNLGRVRKT